MVQISSTFFVLASLVVFGLAVPQYAKRTVGAIEADITAISAQLKSLNTAANNFPSTGGTIGQAIAIHASVVNLESTLKQAAADAGVTAGPLAAPDAKNIASSIRALQPLVLGNLDLVVTKKAAIQKIGGATDVVRRDLGDFQADTDRFIDKLIALVLNDQKPPLVDFKSNVNAGFTKAIAAYN